MSTFTQLFKTLECDFEFVWCIEGGWVVQDFDAQQRDDRHGGLDVEESCWLFP
jgi:hypothetical protein